MAGPSLASLLKSSNTEKQPAHLRPLLESIKSTKEHSDTVIKCRGREWKVHKLIVCSQSNPIAAAIRNFKDGENGPYIMDKQNPQVVEALIRYLYDFDYGDDGNGQGDVAGIVFDVRMSVIADEYFVAPLGDLASRKFKERCTKEWASPDFAKAVSELYENGADFNQLKTTAISTIKAHAKEIFDDELKADFEALNGVLRSTELGADVSRALAAIGDARNTYNCPNCQRLFSVSASGECHFGCPLQCHAKGYSADWWSSYVV